MSAARARRGTGATRILGIPGSLRADSYNRKLLEAARELAPSMVEVELWEGLRSLPPFDEDSEDAPGAAVLELREAIAGADALLIATPQYNRSLPGQLKNALDWASRPDGAADLSGKPVAVITASPSPRGAARAGTEARVVLDSIGAQVLDSDFALAHAHEAFDGAGRLRSAAHRHALLALIERLAVAAAERGAVAVAA